MGNRLYAVGGWVLSGSASVGFIGGALLMCFLRGPWEKGWIGWGGGYSMRRRDLKGVEGNVVEEVSLEEQRQGGEKEEGHEEAADLSTDRKVEER